MTTEQQPSSEFQMVPLEQLHESRFNPRRHFDDAKMAELVDSVKRLGVLTPLLARPNADGYEIAAGHRRYRAAKTAGVPLLPVRIRLMTDGEFLEVITIENLQREDVHPLDEALGYQALMERAGYDVAAIAAKVAKSESYIYQRLKLVDLIEPAKKAFVEDRITAGHAILIARLQAKDQKEALEACFPKWGGDKDHAVSVRELGRWIDENVHLDLNAAPWKKDDAELVPKAGACTTCPKRTGFTPALFPDIAKKDTCTDRACFDAKLQAHIARRKAELEAAGETLVEISTDYAHYGKKPAAGAPLTSDKYTRIEAKKARCESTQKAIVVAGDRDRGRILDVCTDPKCKTHHGGRFGSSAGDNQWRAKQKQADEKRRREIQGRTLALEAILEKFTHRKRIDRFDLELIAIEFFKRTVNDDQKRIFTRKGWAVIKVKRFGGEHADLEASAAAAIRKLVGTNALEEFLFELALSQGLAWNHDGQRDVIRETAKRYSVDIKAIEQQLEAEYSEKRKAKATRARKAAAKAKAAPARKTAGRKPPLAPKAVCEVCKCTEDRACEGGCAWSAVHLAEGRWVCDNCVDQAGKKKPAAAAAAKPKKSAAARLAQNRRMQEYWKKRQAAKQAEVPA